jgi:hypothetical protein
MGAELAGIASTRYAHLPGGPYKVLIRMCLMALDKPNAKGDPDRTYFGGWEPLALALGRDLPNPTDDPEERAHRAHILANEVGRCCRRLRHEGAIKPLMDNPRNRERQIWKLTL